MGEPLGKLGAEVEVKTAAYMGVVAVHTPKGLEVADKLVWVVQAQSELFGPVRRASSLQPMSALNH